MLIIELNVGQLAGLIGILSTILPVIITVLGAISVLININNKMTALEWTTLSKVAGESLLNFYGAGGQPILTGIRLLLWGVGSYKRNILYLLIGISLIALFGVSAIAPLGISTCAVTNDITSVEADVIKADPLLSSVVNDTFSLKELTSIRVCGAVDYQPCPGMKDRLHVDDEYAIDFNKTYSNNAMRYRLLTTSSNDNISYPSYDFMMLSVTTSVRKEGYGIIDTMVVDHDNGGFLVNNVIQPNLKANGSLSWSIQGMWLQPHVSCHSTNLTLISWENATNLGNDWIGYMVINNTDINSLGINPIGDQYQLTDLPTRSIRYSQIIQKLLMEGLNMTANGTFFESPVLGDDFMEPRTVKSEITLEGYFNYNNSINIDSTLRLDAEILCEGYDGGDNISENIVGVNCWTLLGFPIHTTRGIEQTLYSCASVVEASIKTIKLQSSTTGAINVTDVQTIPAQWYIEKGVLNITDMDPWWGGVEFGEKLPNNSLLVSENTLLLPAGGSNIWGLNADANAASAPAIAMHKMFSLEDNLDGYKADGIGNLGLLQQWKENGLTGKGISGMYQRQWNDIMINMVTPTNQAKIVGTVQFTMEKTCYDPRFAIQYFVAMIGLIIIFCILLASLTNVVSFNSLTKIRHVVRQMDLGRAILNVQGYGEASTVGSSKWVKIDGKKLMLLGEKDNIHARNKRTGGDNPTKSVKPLI
nr:15558_t:CDS:2 [Entrophospora candida]